MADFRVASPAHALDFQAVDGVVEHRAVRQQRELLEHHRRLVAAEFAQVVARHLQHIDAVNEHFAGGRVDQPVDVADERRLAGARQAHDHLDATGRHVDVDVLQAEHMAVLLVQFGLAHALLDRPRHGAAAWYRRSCRGADLDAESLRRISHGRSPDASAAACRRPG